MTTFFNKSPDFANISFSKPIKGQDDRYFVACLHKNGSAPASEVLCQFSKQVATTAPLNGQCAEFAIACEDTVDFVKECDDAIVNMCKEHKIDWFSSDEITDSYIEQAFMPSLKDAKKQKNTFILKTRTCKDTIAFNSSKERVELDELHANAKVSIIVQLHGIWFTKTRFGLTWRIRQLKIHETERLNKFGTSLFVEDDADIDDEDIDNVFPEN